MDITWLGHSCFRIKGSQAAIVTDPFPPELGYTLPAKLEADIVTVSHPHPSHSYVQGVGGSPKVVQGPGEYEIAGVLIIGVGTFHDNERGARRGKNTAYLMEIDGVSICHLGDIGHVLSDEQLEEIGDVDVLLVHAPASEMKLVNAGQAIDRTQLMYNDFVIIGPASDPAGIKGMKDADAALKKIAAAKAVFASRGDNSGTNKKELALWKSAGLAAPDKEAWYVQTGQGMIATIRVAEEKNGYTLTDRGTYIKYESTSQGAAILGVVVEGDKVLFNQYSAMAVNPAKCPNVKYDLAKTFIAWMASPATQQRIANFRLLGKQLFTPNAGM